MKSRFFLLSLCALLICSCSKYKADVQCNCHSNSVYKSYDLGIQTRPNNEYNMATCDTLGFHDNVDTCNLTMMGNWDIPPCKVSMQINIWSFSYLKQYLSNNSVINEIPQYEAPGYLILRPCSLRCSMWEATKAGCWPTPLQPLPKTQ